MNDDSRAGRFESLTLRPIGVIHTGLQEPPRPPGPPPTPDELPARMAASPASRERSRVEVFEEFSAGLANIEGYAQLYLLF